MPVQAATLSHSQFRRHLDTSPSDLRVLRRLHARYADRANDLTIVQQGQAAFNRCRSRQSKHCRATARDNLLEDFRRPFEQKRGARLFLGDDNGAKRRLVKPLQKEKIAAIVKHGDRHAPIVLKRFGFGGGRDLFGIGESQGVFHIHAQSLLGLSLAAVTSHIPECKG